MEELRATTQKSYYKKAWIIEDKGTIKLKSYNTIVAKMTGGQFYRLWNGYSVTTMKHINDFRKLYGFTPLSKKEWEALPCERVGHFTVKISNGFTTVKKNIVFDDYTDALSYADSISDGFRFGFVD